LGTEGLAFGSFDIWGSKQMKQKQIKIYSFNRSCIKDTTIASDNLESDIITLSESFLTFAYECYKGITLENDQLIDEIIKVMMPSTKKKQKKNGRTA
jgi:hypothetical protein